MSKQGRKLYRYAVRGKKDKEGKREREWHIQTHKASRKFITHQASPSVSITPKSMTYRYTAYLKMY